MKFKHFFSFLATLIWLIFIFAAFNGFHFWYSGFVLFFWLSLALLNYQHKTTLWCLKNRTKYFIKFYLFLFFVGFVGDFMIGTHLAGLWQYPYYSSWSDWIRLYVIIYPFGGLCILEMIFFLSSLAKEKLSILKADTPPIYFKQLA